MFSKRKLSQTIFTFKEDPQVYLEPAEILIHCLDLSLLQKCKHCKEQQPWCSSKSDILQEMAYVLSLKLTSSSNCLLCLEAVRLPDPNKVLSQQL